jgi:hypothetical protein
MRAVPDDSEWLPAPRYAGEQDDLEAEARRIVALTREAQGRREILERRLRDRLAGYVAVPASDWLERNDAEREQAGGRTYPEEWAERAALASQLPRRGHRARPGRA